MVTPEDVEGWKRLLARLVEGPAPRGETFGVCRDVVRSAPGSEEAVAAARMLLEGAMADATTDVADAQEVMRVLKALSRRELALRDVLPRP